MVESFQSFMEAIEEERDMEVSTEAEVKSEHIWNASPDWDIILPCNADIVSKDKGIDQAIAKFNGKEGLMKQNRKKGEVAIAQHTVGFPDAQGNFKNASRYIYYQIVSDLTIKDKIDNTTLSRSLSTIESYVLKNKRIKIALPEMKDSTEVRALRTLEFFLRTPL